MVLGITLAAALLYPTVVKTGENLFRDERWKSRSDAADPARAQTWEKLKGGPFSSEENAWRTESFRPESSFWRQDVKLSAGRTYLVGMWFRSENARAIMWCWSRTKSGKPFNERLYLYGGFNSCLAPYISDAMRAKLGGGADRWKLIYRPLVVSEELAIPVQFKFGIYMSTGAITIAHPFLIDITDCPDRSLTAEVSGPQAIRSLSLQQVGLRDTVWRKSFKEPVPSFEGALVDSVDMLRGFEQNQVAGHLLSVEYADGRIETVSAPQENAFKVRQ